MNIYANVDNDDAASRTQLKDQVKGALTDAVSSGTIYGNPVDAEVSVSEPLRGKCWALRKKYIKKISLIPVCVNHRGISIWRFYS